VKINLNSRSSTTVIGLLIFLVPFFTYLSPVNLKQLSNSNILEIFLSLILFLIIIFISSFSFEILIKRFFKKNIILFPLLCFAFYLNFLYKPVSDFLLEFLLPTFGFIGTPIFIFFELFCLAIIAFGVKFNAFSIRMILIFSILMLSNALIPLISYLAENIGKNSTISDEIKSMALAPGEALKNRNVYYIIVDEMLAIDPAEQVNIATKKEVLGNLENVGLKYIDKSFSSYSKTSLTLASIMLLDYPHKPSSPRFLDRSNFFPRMMYDIQSQKPLLDYLKKANSSFYWSGSGWGVCIPSNEWSCINSPNKFFSNNLFNFFSTTPLSKSLQRYFSAFLNQDAIGHLLKYIDKNGLPKTPFFTFVHHDSPHGPHLVTSECEPTNYFTQDFKGYKASYHCVLKQIQMFMEKINNIDPEAIVIIQADHGSRDLSLDLTLKEKYQLRGKIFNAIKAPEICFEKYGLPKTNVNTIRFALNCAYGYKFPYKENIHYETYGEESPDFGTVVERKIYE